MTPWWQLADTHLSYKAGKERMVGQEFMYRGVAQLVARTAGGREVAGSSPVTPTKDLLLLSRALLGFSI